MTTYVNLNVKYFFLVCSCFDSICGVERNSALQSICVMLIHLFHFLSTFTRGNNDSAKLIFLTMSLYPIIQVMNTLYCLVQIALYINCI